MSVRFRRTEGLLPEGKGAFPGICPRRELSQQAGGHLASSWQGRVPLGAMGPHCVAASTQSSWMSPA